MTVFSAWRNQISTIFCRQFWQKFWENSGPIRFLHSAGRTIRFQKKIFKILSKLAAENVDSSRFFPQKKEMKSYRGEFNVLTLVWVSLYGLVIMWKGCVTVATFIPVQNHQIVYYLQRICSDTANAFRQKLKSSVNSLYLHFGHSYKEKRIILKSNWATYEWWGHLIIVKNASWWEIFDDHFR